MLSRDYQHYLDHFKNTFNYIVEDVKHYGSFKRALLSNKSKIPACLIEDYVESGHENELFENLDMSEIALSTARFIGGDLFFKDSLSYRDKLSRLILKTHAHT